MQVIIVPFCYNPCVSFYNSVYEIRSPACHLKFSFSVHHNTRVSYLHLQQGKKLVLRLTKLSFNRVCDC